MILTLSVIIIIIIITVCFCKYNCMKIILAMFVRCCCFLKERYIWIFPLNIFRFCQTGCQSCIWPLMITWGGNLSPWHVWPSTGTRTCTLRATRAVVRCLVMDVFMTHLCPVTVCGRGIACLASSQTHWLSSACLHEWPDTLSYHWDRQADSERQTDWRGWKEKKFLTIIQRMWKLQAGKQQPGYRLFI